MKKEKGLKKFNISNKLAYTLMVILSIALFGIGVYAYNSGNNPSIMGHSAGELNLNWGSATSCVGTATNCESIWLQSTCNSQEGCYWGCTGGSFNIYCSGLDQITCNYIGGCSWTGSQCYGSGYDTFYCEDFTTESTCGQISFGGGPSMATPCYWGCGGTVEPCTSATNCASQSGCSVRTIPVSITNNSRGINISGGLQVGALCDPSGLNCVSVKPSLSDSSASQYVGSANFNEMRLSSSVSCPEGKYLSSVYIASGGVNGYYLAGRCRTLPIGY